MKGILSTYLTWPDQYCKLRLAHTVNRFIIKDRYSSPSPLKKNIFLEQSVLYTCTDCPTFSMSTSSDSYTSAIVIWCLAAIVNLPWGGIEKKKKMSANTQFLYSHHLYLQGFKIHHSTVVSADCGKWHYTLIPTATSHSLAQASLTSPYHICVNIDGCI